MCDPERAPPPRRRRKSGCKKRYCECFQAGIKCGEKCKCTDCENPNGLKPSVSPDAGLQLAYSDALGEDNTLGPADALGSADALGPPDDPLQLGALQPAVLLGLS